MSDAEFMEESHTQNNMPGAYPEEQAPFVMAPTTAESNQTPFNMSDIMALDQASTALENNRPDLPFAMSDIRSLSDAPAAAVNDVPGERGSVAQSVPGDVADESWIPIPNTVNNIMVEVTISGTGQKFLVEKDLLCSKSGYFRTALTGGFMEARTNKIPLDERSDLFQIFYHWLKQGNLNFMESNWTMSDGEILSAFVEIYSFADRRDYPDLADLILSKLDGRIRPGGLPVRLDVNIIAMAWDQLPETSKLCHYLVAIERDANKCNLPKRPAVEYECLSGSFVAALLSATENSQWWTAAMVQKQRIDIAKVYHYIKSYGGLARVDRVRGWDSIMRTMGIRAPAGCDQDRLRGQFRATVRRYLRPWDAIPRSYIAAAEEDCPRPLVRQFLHSAASVRPRGRQ